jgi:peptidoglycan/LPS O-acetylase OafA/YrhL
MADALTSPLGGLAVMAVALGLAALLARHIPFYRSVLAQTQSGRHGEIDGLRGYLAFAVFLTHGLSINGWLATGRWEWPPSAVYHLCGTVPVSLFFMITGFLFWDKALRAGGRVDWRRLFVSRLRRLAPLYLAALSVLLLIVANRTGWELRTSPGELAAAVARWSALGFLSRPDINGLDKTWILNTPIWTLQFEWAFYLALPALALVARPRWSWIAALVILALIWRKPGYVVAINFVLGGLAAHLAAHWRDDSRLRSPLAAVLALGAMALTAPVGALDYGPVQSLLLFPLFVCVAAGNSLFGLLSNGAARFLGLVSYSIYLLHCLVLQIVLGTMNGWVAVAGLSAPVYWALLGLIGLVVVLVSAATYRWIEHPFLAGPAQERVANGAGKPLVQAAS